MTDQDRAGAIRIRSNVVFARDSWTLVPGDLLSLVRGAPHPDRRQHDERMYYVPCSICHRRIVQINLEGCDQCARVKHPATLAERKAYEVRVAEARRREADEMAAIRPMDLA